MGTSSALIHALKKGEEIETPHYLAPETISQHTTSLFTDIFSLGTVIWEIFSSGAIPFQRKPLHQVIEFIKTGNMPLIPEYWDPNVKTLLRFCWKSDPKDRPSTLQILQFIVERFDYKKLIYFFEMHDMLLDNIQYRTKIDETEQANDLLKQHIKLKSDQYDFLKRDYDDLVLELEDMHRHGMLDEPLEERFNNMDLFQFEVQLAQEKQKQQLQELEAATQKNLQQQQQQEAAATINNDMKHTNFDDFTMGSLYLLLLFAVVALFLKSILFFIICVLGLIINNAIKRNWLASKRGKLLVSASKDSSIKIWDVDTLETIVTINNAHDSAIRKLLFSMNAHLLCCSEDHTISEWGVYTASKKKMIQSDHSVLCMTWWKGNEYLVEAGTFSDETGDCYINVVKYSAFSGSSLEKTLLGHKNTIWQLIVDVNQLVSCSSDKSVRVWDLESGKCMRVLIGHKDEVYAIYKLDPRCVVSGGKDLSLKFWNISTATCMHTISNAHDAPIVCIEYCKSKKMLITASADQTIKLWTLDMQNIQQGPTDVKTLTSPFLEAFTIIKLNANETQLWCGDKKGNILLWDLNTLTIINQVINAHNDEITTFALH